MCIKLKRDSKKPGNLELGKNFELVLKKGTQDEIFIQQH